MNFRLDLCIYMDNSLVVFWESFLSLPRFWLKMQNKTTFLKINGFGVKPQSHIHGFGPGRATVHPDLSNRGASA